MMAKAVTLLTWPDYIDPVTLEQFNQETKISARLEIVPSAVELVERMRDPGDAVDVLCPPDYAVRELHSDGLLHKLDHALLPNLKHLDPRFRSRRPHDPDCQISVVKDWGTTGYMYRADKVGEKPRSWADFWALAETYSGRVTVLDSPGEVIGAALKMRGHSYNAVDAAILETARTDLLRLRPHLLGFETNYRPLLASGNAVLALGWNGDAAALNATGIPINYVIPNEGSQVWEDDWAIAVVSHHVQEAHRFLDFVLRPEIAAREARYTGYATGNQGAHRLLDEATQNNSSIYPPQHVLDTLESGLPLNAKGASRRKTLWSEIRGS